MEDLNCFNINDIEKKQIERAAKNAEIFTKNLVNALSLNGIAIDSEEMNYVYENMLYAENEKLKASGYYYNF